MVIEVVIQLTASRACFNMRYLEVHVPHDDTAVGSNSEEYSRKGYFLGKRKVLSCLR